MEKFKAFVLGNKWLVAGLTALAYKALKPYLEQYGITLTEVDWNNFVEWVIYAIIGVGIYKNNGVTKPVSPTPAQPEVSDSQDVNYQV